MNENKIDNFGRAMILICIIIIVVLSALVVHLIEYQIH